MLKKLMLGAALAAVIAAPALAQSYDPDFGSGNTINLPAAEATNGAVGIGASSGTTLRSFRGPYAYAPRSYRDSYAYAPRSSHRQCRTYHCDPTQY